MTAAGDALKEEGNAFYKNKEWLKSAAIYTKGIKIDPDNAVLYSNRSASFLQLLKVTKALADADMSIKLRPTWEKGYYRKGCALEATEKYEEALACFRDAAEHNPKNGEVANKIASITRHVRNLQRKKFSFAGKSEPVKSDVEYDQLKDNLKLGDSVPYSKQRVEAWAKKMLSDAINVWISGEMMATVHFLPGRRDEKGETVAGQVSVEKAFDNPETRENCCEFLRKYAKDMSSHATCAVVKKEDIAYPQVWKKNEWKSVASAIASGFFVQVESEDVKELWFVPCDEKKDGGRAIPRDPISLDVDTFRLLPPLIRGEQ